MCWNYLNVKFDLKSSKSGNDLKYENYYNENLKLDFL